MRKTLSILHPRSSILAPPRPPQSSILALSLLLLSALCVSVVPSANADSFPRYLRLTADNVTNTFNLIELTGGVTLTNLGNGTARLVITGGTGGITNATGPGITVDAGILTLSTNGWQFGAALTPWTTNVDAAGFSLMNVGTLAAANIQFGDNSLADMLASRLSTNYNGAWLVGSGGSTNITGGGTWTLSGGSYTFAPTGITAAVQSALDGKVGTNHNGNVSLSNGIYSITSATNSAWSGWSLGNYNYGMGTATTPVPVEVNSSLAVNGYVMVNPRGTGIQRWNWHLFEGWGLESDKRLTLAAGRPAGEAAIFYFQPSADTFHTVRLGNDILEPVGLFVTGSNGWTSINKRAPAAELDVNGKILGTIVQGPIVQATTALVVTNFGYDPAAIGVFIGTNRNFATEIAGGIRNGFIANSGNAFANMVGSSSLSTIYGGGANGDAYRRFRILANGSFLFGDGTYTPDTLVSLGARSNLVMSASLTVSNNVTVTGNLQAPKVLIGSSTNGLAVVGTNLLWITGTTTQKVTLGSYP